MIPHQTSASPCQVYLTNSGMHWAVHAFRNRQNSIVAKRQRTCGRFHWADFGGKHLVLTGEGAVHAHRVPTCHQLIPVSSRW